MEPCRKETDLRELAKDIKCLDRLVATLKQETETQAKEINELKKLHELIYMMSTNLAVMTSEVTGIKTSMEKVEKVVEDIKHAPGEDLKYGKRLVAAGVIGAIVASIMGSILSSF